MYVELHARSAFSFLEGSSLPEELIGVCSHFHMPAMALLDTDGVYGAPRFHLAANKIGLKAHIGAEVTFQKEVSNSRFQIEDLNHYSPSPICNQNSELCNRFRIPLLVRNRTGYQNLCRLITKMKLRAGKKGEGAVNAQELEEHAEGLICLTGGDEGPLASALAQGGADAARRQLDQLIGIFGPKNIYVELQRHFHREEESRNRTAIDLARSFHLPLLATNGVNYAIPKARELCDAFTAIRHHHTLSTAGRLLSRNAERHLKSPREMEQLFSDLPEAIHNTVELSYRLEFTLNDLGYEFPLYPVPAGETMNSFLREHAWIGFRNRYGRAAPEMQSKARLQIEKELALIEKLKLAGYFLIVWDLIRFCREENILVQGRGSAANSAVCYALGITAVDAVSMELLFERFLSEERGEWPDIDLDLPSGDEREKVIQYVYKRYGERGAAMTANVITYRNRMAAREMGKALGFDPETLNKISAAVATWEFRDENDALDRRFRDAGLDLNHPRLRKYYELCLAVQDIPRHLGQHSGGMVICQGQLDSVVPLEPASMPGRVVVQWDKEDCADMGIIKVDLLGLGMMAVLKDSIELIRDHYGEVVDLAHLPQDDSQVYSTLQQADTEAAELGLVNLAVEDGKVVDYALSYAREMARECSPASMAAMKRQVYADYDRTLPESVEDANRLMLESFTAPDFAEGVQSFIERRSPNFAPRVDDRGGATDPAHRRPRPIGCGARYACPVISGNTRRSSRAGLHGTCESSPSTSCAAGTRASTSLTRGGRRCRWRRSATACSCTACASPEFPKDPSAFVRWVEAMNADMSELADELCEQHDFALVHSHDWLVAGTAELAARQIGRPWLTTVHATEWGRHQGWVQTHPQSYIHAIERSMVRNADRIITCSRYMRSHVARVFLVPPSKITAISNGIDPRDLEPVEQPDLDALRARYARPRGSWAAGRQAGVREGLPSRARARSRPVIRGSATSAPWSPGAARAEAELKRQARRLRLGRARLVPGLDRRRHVASLYRIADMSSFRRSTSRLAWSRWRRWRPVCVSWPTPEGCGRSYPGTGRAACASRSRDSAALQEILEQVLTDDKAGAQLVAEAREHVLNFGWAEVAGGTLGVSPTRRAPRGPPSPVAAATLRNDVCSDTRPLLLSSANWKKTVVLLAALLAVAAVCLTLSAQAIAAAAVSAGRRGGTGNRRRAPPAAAAGAAAHGSAARREIASGRRRAERLRRPASSSGRRERKEREKPRQREKDRVGDA